MPPQSWPIYFDKSRRLASSSRSVLEKLGCENIEKTQVVHTCSRAHYNRYIKLAKQLGIAVRNPQLFVNERSLEAATFAVYEAHCKDPDLNTIPLRRFNGVAYSFRAYNGGVATSGQLVCIYKLLLCASVLGAHFDFK